MFFFFTFKVLVFHSYALFYLLVFFLRHSISQWTRSRGYMLVVAFLYDPSAAGVLDSKADSYWLNKFFSMVLSEQYVQGSYPVSSSR